MGRFDLLTYTAGADCLLDVVAYARPPHTTFSSLTALHNALVAIVYALQYLGSHVLRYHYSVVVQH